jgi:hypothetical protein
MRPIIAPDSPLIRLPETVPPIQASFFDAVRLSAQFVDIAYRRVEGAVTQLVNPEHDRALAIMPVAFMDAWAIVDTVHRLRDLLRGLPRYRNQALSKRLFLQRTEAVEQLRNTFQHLVGDLPALTQADAPVLGSLTWLRPVDIERRTLSVWSFMPGRLRSLDSTSVVQIPADVPTEISQIELWLGDKSVNISKLRASVADVVSPIEQALRLSAQGESTLCDSLSYVVLELLPPEKH